MLTRRFEATAEEVNIFPDGRTEFYRAGVLISCPRFSTEAAAHKWVDALFARSAQSLPYVRCVNCED